MKVLNEMKLEIEGRSVNEGFARAAVAAFASQLDPTLEEIGDIKTAVSEAVSNCIIHAYPDVIGRIWITCRILEGEYIEITVRDRGIGIEDVDAAMTPGITSGGEERAGLGFTIMQSFMHTLTVKSVPGKGTTVRMRRHINCRAAGARRP